MSRYLAGRNAGPGRPSGSGRVGRTPARQSVWTNQTAAAGNVRKHHKADVAAEPEDIRRLVPARDDLRPLYLNSQGLYVGVSGGVLKVKEKERLVQEVRINDICQVNLLGNIQMTTQAIQALCQADVPIGYFSMGGWFYGLTRGLNLPNVLLRREQFRWADIPGFCLRLARALVSGKIKNQRTLLMRNHVEPPPAGAGDAQMHAGRCLACRVDGDAVGDRGECGARVF